uniref:Uncharacterized protein n=1 Tax=Biomphalaria glabrata TaxID=6526 RepID=A0A2C9K9X4_BIOGL
MSIMDYIKPEFDESVQENYDDIVTQKQPIDIMAGNLHQDEQRMKVQALEIKSNVELSSDQIDQIGQSHRKDFTTNTQLENGFIKEEPEIKVVDLSSDTDNGREPKSSKDFCLNEDQEIKSNLNREMKLDLDQKMSPSVYTSERRDEREQSDSEDYSIEINKSFIKQEVDQQSDGVEVSWDGEDQSTQSELEEFSTETNNAIVKENKNCNQM